jgi:hypothetical protein
MLLLVAFIDLEPEDRNSDNCASACAFGKPLQSLSRTQHSKDVAGPESRFRD